MSRKEELRRSRARRHNAKAKASGRHRLSVFRSNNAIYGSLISPEGKILFGASSLKEKSSGGIAGAQAVGKKMAELAKEKGIESIVFDRNGFLYHGRVKAFADSAREAGIKI